MDSSFSCLCAPRARSHALGVGGVCLKTGNIAEARCYAVAMRYEKISITTFCPCGRCNETPVQHTEIAMADLHNDVTYEGWGKTSAAGHRECMGNSKRGVEKIHQFASRKERSSPCANICYPKSWCIHK